MAERAPLGISSAFFHFLKIAIWAIAFLQAKLLQFSAVLEDGGQSLTCITTIERRGCCHFTNCCRHHDEKFSCVERKKKFFTDQQ